MNSKERQTKVVTLYHLMRQCNEMLREFTDVSPEPFKEIYEANVEFVDALEFVLLKHNMIKADDRQH